MDKENERAKEKIIDTKANYHQFVYLSICLLIILIAFGLLIHLSFYLTIYVGGK